MTLSERLADQRELAMAKAASKSTRKGFGRTAYAKTFASK